MTKFVLPDPIGVSVSRAISSTQIIYQGTLAPGEQFSPAPELILDYNALQISVKATEDSAAGGAQVRLLYTDNDEEIADPSPYTIQGTNNIPAGDPGSGGFTVELPTQGARKFAIDYTNGAVATDITIEVTYAKIPSGGVLLPGYAPSVPSLHRLQVAASLQGRSEDSAPNDPDIKVKTTASGELSVANVKRDSEFRGRLRVFEAFIGITSDTIIRTVTPGHRLYMQQYSISVINDSISTQGFYGFTDDGEARQSFSVPGRILGGVGSANSDGQTSNDPVSFLTDVTVENLSTAALTMTGYIAGYEEPI